MEKLICNKKLALSSKAPLLLSKVCKGSKEVRARNEGLGHLQQQAFSVPLLEGRWAEIRWNSFIRHHLEPLLCES